MSAYRRNVYVGVTVLIALTALGWMLLRFGAAPAKLVSGSGEIKVQFYADRADGLSEGAQVMYHGVTVGRTGSMRLDSNQLNVIIEGLINSKPPLPQNVVGQIKNMSMIGSSTAINLDLTGAPTGQMSGGQVIETTYMGSELESLGKTTKAVRDAQIVERAGKVLKSLQDYLEDPQIRDDLRSTIHNARMATESATRVANNLEKVSQDAQKLAADASGVLTQTKSAVTSAQGNVEQLTKQLGDRLQQVSRLLEGFQNITDKVNKGEGTAGMLVNDPRLYQSLVESTKQLNSTITDLNRLVQQWEQEGVAFKLH